MYNQFATLRRIVYTLKQQFGWRVTYLVNNGATINVETGITSRNDTKIPIKKAVKLPKKVFRQTISVFGKTTLGDYDKADVLCIVDPSDLMGSRPKLEDHIEADGLRFSIGKFEELDGRVGYLLYLTALVDEEPTPNQISDTINLSHSVSWSIE